MNDERRRNEILSQMHGFNMPDRYVGSSAVVDAVSVDAVSVDAINVEI